jgi:hypothetical protein
MKNIVINIWHCQKPDGVVEKLTQAGLSNARIVDPWNGRGSAWALSVDFDPVKCHVRTNTDHIIMVGWIIGLAGCSYECEVDFAISEIQP